VDIVYLEKLFLLLSMSHACTAYNDKDFAWFAKLSPLGIVDIEIHQASVSETNTLGTLLRT